MSPPNLPRVLNTSDHNLRAEFYEPCLQWAAFYDRGVGYFTSGWLREYARGMSLFASRGGKARWLTSPLLDERDFAALRQGLDGELDGWLVDRLKRDVAALKASLEYETLNALAWMVYDKVIEFRFAIPTKHLEGGNFHDKFGIFSDHDKHRVSFNGSQNDSSQGLINYESIKIFPSWEGFAEYADDDQSRFNRLWENKDHNVRVYALPEAVKEHLIALRTSERPYSSPIRDLWRHQDEAVKAFLTAGHGILEMATGTGKTRTALKIANELLKQGRITSVLVVAPRTDLLEQWRLELLRGRSLCPHRYYDHFKELLGFTLAPANAALLVAREPAYLQEVLKHIPLSSKKQCLIIFDEVHGAGAPALALSLKGGLTDFAYRLGLSATPEREYDEVGTTFIKEEIGDVVYEFGLEDGIRRGILCEFDYYPLEYTLAAEDRQQMRSLIIAYNKKKERGEFPDETALYRALAQVRKVSQAKLPVFADFVAARPDVLNRCIIFVATSEFGLQVQEIVIRYNASYHTYFQGDDREKLRRFASGELSCLLACHRISEGIDIKSVDNIILLSADRARLETIQRIGRSLRTNPANPAKRATVVDFIGGSTDDNLERISSDQQRREWLVRMAAVKKEV